MDRMFSRFLRFLLVQVGFQGVLVLAIVWFGFLIIDGTHMRWDLTEDQRFTISEASHKLAADLEDPLTIRVYMSKNVPPRYEPLQRQVLDILAEYEVSSDRIKVERYDPDDSRTAENEAKNYNIQPVQLPVYEATSVQVLRVYGGIVLVYRDKNSEVINFAARYQQGYEGLSALEYEISSKIWQLSHERAKLGLTGYLASLPPGGPMGPGRGQPQPKFNGLRRILGEAFEIEDVDLDKAAIDPGKIPLLLVVRPKDFSDVATFRLDQYLMQGGRIIMFITKGELQASQWSPNFTWGSFRTGLDEWLKHNGLQVPEEFVVHAQNANPIYVRGSLGGIPVDTPVPSWFRPKISSEDSFSKENPAVQTLKLVSMFWPHPVDVVHDRLAPGVRNTILVRSHEQESWRWKDLRKVDMRMIDMREDGPKSEAEVHSSPVAVALEGNFSSYYQKPESIPPSLKEKEEGSDEAKDPEVIRESTKSGHLVVVGNSIFISDDVLMDPRSGQVNPTAQEQTLLAFNLIDWLARSEALIALRAKKFSSREIVDEEFEDDIKAMRKKAEEKVISAEKFREMYDEARERQESRRKRWRWKNIIIPSVLVLLAAGAVWVLRAAARARPAKVPKSVPPDGSKE